MPDLGLILHNLGGLYSSQNVLSKAESSFLEALNIRKNLAEEDPTVYLSDYGVTSTNFGLFFLTCKKDKNKSLYYIDTAITSLWQFQENPKNVDFILKALNALESWSIDPKSYLRQKFDLNLDEL